jgi:hypothetical protein
MFNNLPIEINHLIINYLLLKDIINFRIIDKTNEIISKSYESRNMIYVKKLPKNLKKSFPKIKNINISRRINLSDYDFQYLNQIEKLDMSQCIQTTITNNAFSFLVKIKELNLEDCCRSWKNGHHFTDEIFQYLTNLEKFNINENHVITDSGIQKLTKIKDLTISNCSNITNHGISNLTNLVKLKIYNLCNLSDDVFINLTKLEKLDISFTNITDRGISYLTNIKKITLSNCNEIKLIGFNKLQKLNEIFICSRSINDADLIHLKYINKIIFYGCNINGSGISFLSKVKEITIYQSPIIDEFLDNFVQLKNLEKINIFRCYQISDKKKNELRGQINSKILLIP